MEFLKRIFVALCVLASCSAAQAAFISGVNVANVGFNSNTAPEQPFLNILHQSIYNTLNSSNSDTGEGVLLYQSFLDSSGWPTTLTGGPTHTFTRVQLPVMQSYASPIAPFQYYQAGDYLLQWTGTGQFRYNIESSSYVSCSSTTSPCAFTVSSPGNNGILIQLTCTTTNQCTSSGSTTDYAKNWSLVYCGTWNGTHCSNGADTQIMSCQAGTYTQCFNPAFLQRYAGIKAIRFMKWMLTFQQDWAVRKLPTWYSYVDSPTSLSLNGDGAGIVNFSDGVPAEIIFGLCNVLNVQICWVNMPANATDAYATSFATSAHSSLNSGIRLYVEYANEIWNQSQPLGQTGEITAKIDNGSGSAGNILTVTAIGPDGSTPILHAPLTISGAGIPNDNSGFPIYQIIAQTGGAPGGIGTYTLTTMTSSGSVPLLISSETMGVHVAVQANIENAAAATFSGLTTTLGSAIIYGEHFRPVQIWNDFKVAWGADSARVIGVAAGQNACAPCSQGPNCILTALPTGASACDASWGGPATWYAGGPSDVLANHAGAYAIAPYWGDPGYRAADAWTADSDGGLQSFFTELTNGGLFPAAIVTGNCGNGAGKTCTPVDTAHYTLTTGKSLAADPPNGTMFMATVNAVNTSSSGQTFLTVDSMATYPMLYNNSACPGTNMDAGIIPDQSGFAPNANAVFMFTSAIAGCPAGSITKGWRVSYQPWYNTPGMINDVLAWAAQNCTTVAAVGGGIPLVAYENGFGITVASPAGPTTPSVILYTNALRDARMGTAQESNYNKWKHLSGGCTVDVVNQFDDIEAMSISGFGAEFWGAYENVNQTSSPRGDTIHNFSNGNPGGRLNFLFSRDLNPASNDNSPVFLNKAA